MTISQTIRRAVEKEDYIGTAESIGKACEDVFGYKKIAECSIEGIMNSKNNYLPSPIITVINSEDGVIITLTNSSELLPSPDRPEFTKKTFDKCFHYGKNSRESPEGIIANLTYTRIQNEVRLGSESFELNPVELRAYGGDWFNDGELTPVPPCFLRQLKISQDILTMSKIDFENFIKLIEKREKS